MKRDEEDFIKHRPGRVSLEDEALAHAFFKHGGHKVRYGSTPRRAAQIRWRNCNQGRGDLGRKEAVVKSVARFKHAQQVHKCIRYVSRLKKDQHELEKPQLYDQFAQEVTPVKLDEWQLPKEKEIPKKGRVYNQAWHLVCSVQSDPDLDADRQQDQLKKAVAEFVRNEFAKNYFCVIWAVHHEDGGHPHAHLIVKAKPRYGPRLHFDKMGDKMDILRDGFANALNGAGLDYVATRREDRMSLRAAILSGNAPVRRKDTAQYILAPKIMSQVIREAGQVNTALSSLWAPQLPTPPKVFEEVYERPAQAFSNWLWLVDWAKLDQSVEKRHRLALWMLTSQPLVFGALKQDAPRYPQELLLKKLNGLKITPMPKNWKPDLKPLARDKQTSLIKYFASIGRMFAHAISEREERHDIMKREFRSLLVDMKIYRQDQTMMQGPAKSTKRRVRSLLFRR